MNGKGDFQECAELYAQARRALGSTNGRAILALQELLNRASRRLAAKFIRSLDD